MRDYEGVFKTAKRKGFIAGLQGKSEDECPYRDIRAGKYDQVVTWSRGFQHAWLEGWREGHKKYQEITSHPKWRKPVPHRCPLCGYKSTVTNICRKCNVPMAVEE